MQIEICEEVPKNGVARAHKGYPATCGRVLLIRRLQLYIYIIYTSLLYRITIDVRGYISSYFVKIIYIYVLHQSCINASLDNKLDPFPIRLHDICDM